jgi:hypothetical protein
MRNVPDKIIEKIKTHILCSWLFPENRAVYEIWKNMVQPDRLHVYNAAQKRCALHAGITKARIQHTL